MVTETKVSMVLSDRVRQEKEELFSATPRIDLERSKYLMEVYEETEGQPKVIRRAKFFDRLCRKKTIFIDNNPIVGTLTRYKYGSYLLPELGIRWMKKVDQYRLPLGYATVTEKEKEGINKAVDFWKDINIFNRTREVILQSHGVDVGVLQKCGVATEATPGGLMQTMPDYAWVLNKGLKGIIAEIEEERAKLDIGNSEDLDRWYFHNATIMCLEAMIELARRYASLARKMAAKEADVGRKQELARIAEICEWVPANPARNFREALQSVWFTCLGVWLENTMTGVCCPARFTQYLYPFYKKDKEAGKLTDNEAIELLQLYFLKIQALGQILPPFGFKYSQSRLALHLSLGGLTPNGDDATNELDYLVIDAKKALMIPEPLILFLYHDQLPEEFLLKGVELIRTGIGQPAFYDVRKIIQRSLLYRKGITVEEARNCAIFPCVQDAVPGYTDVFWEGNFNNAKMLELALNNGTDPVTGIQLGPQTGDADSFRSYEKLYDAVIAQVKYFLPLVRTISRVAWNMSRDFPVPFGSALTHDCIQKGKDMVDGGARYPDGEGTSFVGTIDLANSLASIKRLVFEEKKLTLRQLKEALAADFEGHEEIHRMCLATPKYGNGDGYVNSIAKELYRFCAEEHQRFPDFLGRPIMPHAFSASSHGPLGELTGALPSGRRARLALADASVSPQPGTDKNGPTTLVMDAASLIDTVKYGSNHFNMKFHPVTFKSPEASRKFLSLIKTYMDLGGYHVQFNCVSSETLKDAKAHPENYRNLIVRVAGFSAYFTLLEPTIQDEIIKRTELTLA